MNEEQIIMPAIEKNVQKKSKPIANSVQDVKPNNKHTLNGKQAKETAKSSKSPKKSQKKSTVTKTKSTKSVPKQKLKSDGRTTKITFQLKYHTEYGQNLFLTGNHELLGNGAITKALPLQYFNDEFWYVTIELNNDQLIDASIVYNYVLINQDGYVTYDWGSDKTFNPANYANKEILIVDAWNYAGYFENTFYTEPFKNVLLKSNHTNIPVAKTKSFTHTFKVKAPLLTKGQTLCIIGSGKTLGDWKTEKAILMSRKAEDDFYSVNINLSKETFPIAYKYGVYDVEQNKFLQFEGNRNRFLYDSIQTNKQTIVNDGFAILPNTTWKGAGVAIPVFSLRTEKSFGIGEFTDLKLLVDWSKTTGLKLIQILPVNDTTATHTWMDSYPYAAISAFALHPVFLNLSQLIEPKHKNLLDDIEAERKRLNALDAIDYEAVIKLKWEMIKKIYPSQKKNTFNSQSYKDFFEQNKHWLVSYAVFCYLRDEYGTSDFSQWPAYKHYHQNDIDVLAAADSEAFDDIAIHYFVQYHLHIQLKEATEYAHQNGIIVKGDIPIGIYRFGADAWQHSNLYHMDCQAGAPPDDFAVKGQNWGFPTYNWQSMKEDGFAWWKQRFAQMSYYFDAFRIDHILGFFRIWSIPMNAVEGIMGHFVPAIPVHLSEFMQQGIWFDHYRYTKPFINNNVLWEIFGYDNEEIKNTYLNYDGFDQYTLKNEFATQRAVEKYFAALEDNEHHQKIKQGIFDLISNVILFEEEGNPQQFHFRFGMENTLSFQNLEGGTQNQLKELYINYFFRRQDNFWMKEAMNKLPALKRVTNMMVCGEDLGLVPACVPDVMKQLGLLSLEIQRMPKDPKKEFFHPNDAPYLSVVTPSTHDMSTIRGWWEEDKTRIQKFYNNELGQWGDAPFYCEAWINKTIVWQHLYSPAMWSIFQLQDLFGINEKIRRVHPDEERINVPSNPKHYWRYRMHLTLEELLNEDDFNNELQSAVQQSGR